MRINFDIGDMEAFIAVAQRLSYVAAAEDLHISPSSLSRKVQRLEMALDRRLLDRTTRDVSLTIAGEQLLPRAEELIAEMTEIQLFLKGKIARPAPSLTVACVPSLVRRHVPPVARAFQQAFPHARFRLLDVTSPEIIEAIRGREAEFGLSYMGYDEPSFEFVKLEDEPFVLAVAKDHEFARRGEVAWTALANQKLISPWRESGIRVILDQALAKTGVSMRWFHEVRHVASVLVLVAAGMGVSVVPMSVMSEHAGQEVVAVRLIRPSLSRPVNIVKLRGKSLRPMAQAMWDMLVT